MKVMDSADEKPVPLPITDVLDLHTFNPKDVKDLVPTYLVEAARLAPSACNQQPWRFAVVRDPEARRRIVEEGFLPGIQTS